MCMCVRVCVCRRHIFDMVQIEIETIYVADNAVIERFEQYSADITNINWHWLGNTYTYVLDKHMDRCFQNQQIIGRSKLKRWEGNILGWLLRIHAVGEEKKLFTIEPRLCVLALFLLWLWIEVFFLYILCLYIWCRMYVVGPIISWKYLFVQACMYAEAYI